MAEPKTQRTKASVSAFIGAVENETRRKDAKTVDKILRELTGEKPAMWGPSIVGYGQYQSPTGPWPRAGFSPRKTNLVVYVAPESKDTKLMQKLGKHKTGVSCIYITKLADVDEGVLRDVIAASLKYVKETYPSARTAR